MAHLPTPWELVRRGNYGEGEEADIEGLREGFMRGHFMQDDAALIVRAVNAFEANEALIKELVEALKAAAAFLANEDEAGFGTQRMDGERFYQIAYELQMRLRLLVAAAEVRS